ncbi:MAG: ankyrin repeat domain-containing protein [Treponema sp.]|nr:ankyrin repeat domain-containing protein [Treponema sp.]
MSRLYVPVIINGDVSLFDVECNEHEDGLLINGNSPDEDAGIQTLADKAASFQKSFCGWGDASAQILISDRDREADAEIQFDDSTQSVTLGVLVELYRCLNHGSYKDKWDYIVATGDWSPKSNSVDSVDKITHKFEAVKELAREDPSKRIIFVYVDSGLPLETGYSKEFSNVFVSGFKSGADFREIKAEILAPEFSEEQEELLKKADNFSDSNFFETTAYLELKSKIKNCKGIFIDGRSDSGKTILASALVRYAMAIGIAYAPLWIRVNNHELSERLKQKHGKKQTVIEYLKEQVALKGTVCHDEKYLLVIDNIEFDFADEILSALQDFIRNNEWVSLTLVTCWNRPRKKDVFDELGFKEYSLSSLQKEDFLGIYQMIVREDFSSALQRATKEELVELENLLYNRLSTKPGSIKMTLNALNEMSVTDLIDKMRDIDSIGGDSDVFFFNLSFERLGLFAQIVLYVFTSFFVFSSESCTDLNYEDFVQAITRRKLVDGDLLSQASVKKAFKQIEANYFVQESASGYAMKSDTLHHILFQNSTNDFAAKMEQICNFKDLRWRAAISFAWLDDLKNSLNDDPQKASEMLWFASVCSKSLDVLRIIAENKLCGLDYTVEGGNALHYIAQVSTNISFLDYLLHSGKQVELKGKNGDTVLHRASLNENTTDMLKYVLDNKVYQDIDERDIDGYSAFLSVAATAKTANSLKLLEEYGCNIFLRNNDGFSALHLAATNEHIGIIKYIIENKLFKSIEEKVNDENERDGGATAFLLALKYNTNIDVIKFLLDQKVDYTAMDNDGRYSLIYAAYNKNADVIKLVLENNLYVGDINKTFVMGWTAAHVAAYANPNLKVLELLVSHGADLSLLTDNNESVFELAMQYNESIEVTKYLVDKISTGKLLLSSDALYRAEMLLVGKSYRKGNPRIEIIKFLRESGFDFIHKPKGDSSLLYLETWNENPEMLKHIFSYGFSYGDRPLFHRAVENENPEVLKYFIFHHIYDDINETDIFGQTALYIACCEGNEEAFHILLRAGADYKIKTNRCESVLHAATEAENVNLTRYIIEKGLYDDIDEENGDGFSALQIAVRSNKKTDVIELLLDAGASMEKKGKKNESILDLALNNESVDVQDYFWLIYCRCLTSNEDNIEKLEKMFSEPDQQGGLWDVAKFGNLDSLKPSLEGMSPSDIKKRVNEKDADGHNAFFYAVRSNNFEMFKYLEKAGSDIGQDSEDSILHEAVRQDNLEITKYILESYKDIDINAYDCNGCTPLHLACGVSRNIDIFKLLLSYGADKDMMTNDGEVELSVLHLAVIAGNTELVRFIIDSNLFRDIDCEDKNGLTPLFWAVRQNQKSEIMDLLVQNGADWGRKAQGKSMLMSASENASVAPLEYILKNKLYTDLDERDTDGNTALLNAAESGNNPAALAMLVSAGANLYARNNYGQGILHRAASNENLGIVQAVVENLCYEDVESKGLYGETSLHVAAYKNNFPVFEYLLHLGLNLNEPDKKGVVAIDCVEPAYRAKYIDLIARCY